MNATRRIRRLRQRLLKAIERSAGTVIDHLPLFIGLVFLALVHLGRDLLVPTDHRVWVRIVDVGFWVAEAGILITLVGTGAVESLTELAEAVIVGVHRIRAAWSGQPLRGPRPRLPHGKEGDDASDRSSRP